MSWHYQLMRHTEPDGEVWYGVHEAEAYAAEMEGGVANG
jgi:hypothetical protein